MHTSAVGIFISDLLHVFTLFILLTFLFHRRVQKKEEEKNKHHPKQIIDSRNSCFVMLTSCTNGFKKICARDAERCFTTRKLSYEMGFVCTQVQIKIRPEYLYLRFEMRKLRRRISKEMWKRIPPKKKTTTKKQTNTHAFGICQHHLWDTWQYKKGARNAQRKNESVIIAIKIASNAQKNIYR